MTPKQPSLADEARDAGESTYFTGRPCLRGHIANRLVSNNACTTCRRERDGSDTERDRQERMAAKAKREAQIAALGFDVEEFLSGPSGSSRYISPLDVQSIVRVEIGGGEIVPYYEGDDA